MSQIKAPAPPLRTHGISGWIFQNLLSSPLNIALTLLSLWLLWWALPPIFDWALLSADFRGSDQSACTSGGACWVFVRSRLSLFIYGFFPDDQVWRVNLVFVLLALTLLPLLLPRLPARGPLLLLMLLLFPLAAWGLMSGGFGGLERVETNQWGGLSLTLILAFAGIVLALPFGILLALGRRSEMPVIRALCVVFIELWRGVPLISVLFMASVMLPLFLPDGVSVDKLLRALIGIVMFQSAYMAEVIRGGLQAIPKGQYEAAAALGLGYWKSMRLVILPQALKMVIPGIVNTFIALFKDTTLVLIIGLFDVLAAVQSAIADPAWRNVSTEGYVFAALVFWIFCFSMSRYSQSLEKKLHTGHARHDR